MPESHDVNYMITWWKCQVELTSRSTLGDHHRRANRDLSTPHGLAGVVNDDANQLARLSKQRGRTECRAKEPQRDTRLFAGSHRGRRDFAGTFPALEGAASRSDSLQFGSFGSQLPVFTLTHIEALSEYPDSL